MRVLLVSGDPPFASALVAALAALADPVDAEVTESADGALDRLGTGRFDAVAVDLASGTPSAAVVFVSVARSRVPSIPIVALAQAPDASVDALAAGADGFGHRDPKGAAGIATVLRQTRERFLPDSDAPLRVLYVSRHAPPRDDPAASRMTIELVAPTPEATVPPPYEEGPLTWDAAVVDASAGGADLIGIVQDLVARLGTAPLVVLADATDRQMARAVLRLGASQVVAKTGAWPVRLFAAIRQAVERRSDGSDEGHPPRVTPEPPVPASAPGPVEVVPLEQQTALAAQLDAALRELDDLRATVDQRIQDEASALRQAWNEATREAEAARAAEVQAAGLEIRKLEALLLKQGEELDAARELAATSERALEAAREVAAQAERELAAARSLPQMPEPPPKPDGGDRGFTLAASDFVREIARHAGEAARLQRTVLEHSDDSPDRTSLNRALAAAVRAQEVAQQFLAFDESRLSPPSPIALDELLASLLPVLTAITGGSVRLSLSSHLTQRALVPVPRAGVARLVASLVAAAVDALPLGGHIDVEASIDPPGADTIAATARLTVAARGFGKRPLRAPEAIVSPLPSWSADLRLKETDDVTAYELEVPATVAATSGPGSPEP